MSLARSFTRFERHCGSRAKKWRLSLRIEPGSVPECGPADQPLSLGQWLDGKGLGAWAPRGSIKIGPKDDDDDEGYRALNAANASAPRALQRSVSGKVSAAAACSAART